VRRLVAAAAALFVLALAPGAAHAAVTFNDGDGLHVVSVRQVDSRLYAIALKTAALPQTANVYVLLPPGYGSDMARRYPVFYLLHGTSGRAADWTSMGDAEKTIGNRQLITVMPDIDLNGDGGGWCSDWPNGAERWETFHIRELIPWIDANLKTIKSRAGRAIAGLSQGGFCSLSYAARHPDMFGTALGYSGAPDIYFDPDARAGAQSIINATEVALDHVPPNTFFGDPLTNGINWAAHDPATIAENLRSTRMYMYWGNGQSGPLDTPSSFLSGTTIETLVSRDNDDFEARLHSLGLPAFFDPYGPGTHSWPYWARDLRWSIDKVMSGFAHPEPNPKPFTYMSADSTYAVYGWRVAMRRTAREFSTLQAGGNRFSLAGSGSGIVTTPPAYRPHRRYRVTLSGDKVSKRSVVLKAGRGGRLRIQVPLGPANPNQEYTAQAQLTGTAVYKTNARIARMRKR
jgi:S-formylglutathione hydrolase FrmB